MTTIDASYLASAMTFDAYLKLIKKLLKNKQTTGPNHSDDMLHYTRMNLVRMERLAKTVRLCEPLRDALAKQGRFVTWLTITEAWCGDAAQSIPVLEKAAHESYFIEHKLILRDEHPELIDAFLTNGGRSIPKVIMLDSNSREVLATWGPRPQEAQKLSESGRLKLKNIEDAEERTQAYYDVLTLLQKWYARDKTKHIQEELLELIRQIPRKSIGKSSGE